MIDAIEYFKGFNGTGGAACMDGREKGDLSMITGEELHIGEFAFLSNDEGEYAVFTLAEYPSEFFFGNSIITEMLKQVQADGMALAMRDIPVKFEKRISRKGRDYMAFRFVC